MRRLQLQKVKAGRYHLYIADDARGELRLQMHFFTGLDLGPAPSSSSRVIAGLHQSPSMAWLLSLLLCRPRG